VLSGYRVLDLCDDRGFVAGFLLAQMGAEVIMVEPPEGLRHRHKGPYIDGIQHPERSLSHLTQDRGKSSVVISDNSELTELAMTADVLLECGAFQVDLDLLRSQNPGLVTISISAYGSDGPKKKWPASDITIAAASGAMSLTGDGDRPPVRVGIPQTWNFAGADAACAAALALYERESSGLGQHADIAAQVSYLSTSQFRMLGSFCLEPQEPQTRFSGGVRLGPLKIQYVHPCADGYVTVTFLFGAMVGPYSNRLMKWIYDEGECAENLRDEDFVSYANRVLEGEATPAILEEATETISSFVATRTKEDLLQAALAKNLLIAPIADMNDVMNLGHLQDRDYWDSIDVSSLSEGTLSGTARICGPMTRSTSKLVHRNLVAPGLGADTERVMRDLSRRPLLAPAESRRRRPLEGVKVLDFMWALAGPAATRTLADFGATVIKIESETRPDVLRGVGPFRGEEGDPEGSFQFHSLNAGKLGLGLDLNNQEAKGVLEDLVRWADVVTDSFSAGAMKKWGLDYEGLRKINPKIIAASSCLMGQTGPMAKYAGFGTMAAAIAGFYPITGWADRTPSGPYSAFTDYGSPRFTVLALVSALHHRLKTGEGQYIDFSQLEGALHFLAPALLDKEVNGVVATRMGNRDAVFAPQNAYPCIGEDSWIALSCETDEHWRALSLVIGYEEIADLNVGERRARHDYLDEIIGQWTSRKSVADAEKALISAGVPAHRVLGVNSISEDEQLRFHKAFVEVEHGTCGTSWVEATPIKLSATPAVVTDAAPTYGQHSFRVLTEILNYSEDRFADLAVSEVLK
jgi:crotonobetainyl-CoA:carnitine CoA-transferase CaiB-like acyl-CoA transferase|tara:strand:+ start:70 stop:2481 length:2412 start_codon:yes stop_codon:yes gene_type:complete